MIRILLLILTLGLFISCEKELDIQPKNSGDLLAVDASIENGGFPRVILTKTFDYFSTLTIADLEGAFVSGAKVTLSDGVKTSLLREYKINSGQGTAIIYSIDTANPAGIIIGKLNTNYQLTIEANGKTYTSRTTIPTIARKMDSAWWKPAPNNPDTNKVVVFTKITDPKGLGNYIRYFTSRNDSGYLPGLNSVFDDLVIDGTTYDAQVDRGVDRNQKLDFEEYGYFKKGDTVDLKLSNIDKNTYDFWRTWEQNQSNIGNPFSVPVKVLGNISNGALGYFGGYASQTLRLIIPK